LISSGKSIPSKLWKIAPKDFVAKLRRERRKKTISNFKGRIQFILNPKSPKQEQSKLSWKEKIADELNTKATDAMLSKLPGSYGSGKKRR
jgi:hypothetical protein